MSHFSNSNYNNSFLDKINNFRLIIKNIFFFIFFVIVILIFVGGFGSSFFRKEVKSGSVLYLNPTGTLFEDNWWSDTEDLDSGFIPNSYFFDITEALRVSLLDDEIDTILVNTSAFLGGSFPQLREIVALLNRHKEKGNKVIAYSYSFNQSGYYLASVADQIIMDKEGVLIFEGFGQDSLFFGGFLEKYKIDVEVFKAGDYKSAVEPFLRKDMSELSRANLSVWINELWDLYLEEIAQNRSLKLGELIDYADHFDQLLLQTGYSHSSFKSALMSQITVDKGLVDKLVANSINDGAKEILEKASLKGDVISYEDYAAIKEFSLGGKVAILSVEGSIGGGVPDVPGRAGSDRFIDELDSVINDKSVKAIVLRINSPGGSAFASEQMRLALVDAQEKSKKPIVLSLGGMAASGGYWLAMSDSIIVADKATITGSIGVFGMMPSFQRTLEANFGITVDGVSTGGMGSTTSVKKMSAKQRLMVQASVDSTYGQFLSLVCQSRHLEREVIEPFAGGRVFTGRYAFDNGLVDQLGGFYTAVDLAAQKAGLKKYQIDFRKRQKNMFEKALESVLHRYSPFSVKLESNFFQNNSTLKMLKEFASLEDPNGLYSWTFYNAGLFES